MEISEEITDSLNVEECVNSDDKDFCYFYYKAVKRLLDIDKKAEVSNLHRYFKIFGEYYNFWCQKKPHLEDRDNIIIELLYDTLYYRIAYVYRNGTLLSSAVAFHFRNVYNQSPKDIKRLMTKSPVKICSIGCRSASDIVAIVTVMESFSLKDGAELDFRVSIIEPDERWKITCLTVLRGLEQFRRATWKITFIHVNLGKKNAWTQETLEAIQEADVITMIRFLSEFNHGKKILKRISENLKPQAMLFVLDRPLLELIELSFGITESEDFELIHKELCDFHTLNIEAFKHLRMLYHKHFGDKKHFRVNLSINVFIGIWIKVSPKSAVKYQNSLDCLFQNNTEKYNPKLNFLNSVAFMNFEHSFTKRKEGEGWTPRRIDEFVQMEMEKRNHLLIQFTDIKEELDAAQNHLLHRFQLLIKEGRESNEGDEKCLESYLKLKKVYSTVKKNVYYSSLYKED